MGKVEHLLNKFRLYRGFILWTKRTALPGFQQLPIYTVAVFFFHELGKESLVTKSSSLAYSFLLAIFPAIIFLFTLIPYIPIEGFQDHLMSLLMQILPYNAYKAAEDTLFDIIKNQNVSLLSFGFITALFFSTNGVNSLMRAFNKASLVAERRTFIRKRTIALLLTLYIAISLVVGITFLIAGEFIINFLESEGLIKGWFLVFLLQSFRWLVISLLFLFATSILYYYGPSTTRSKRFITPGSVLAMFLAIIVSICFAFYINRFGNYNKLYGSIGTLIVIMIWLYINSMIILIGYELNASIELSKRSLIIAEESEIPDWKRRKNPSGEKNRLKTS
ncbi:YihY/virulence factor BrkB family protein [Solitalea longa]|uniref:YihY/virulence factor BrkB family protein n=1 Tax=Solitalea longa TaxID=2079460 RepID=A0A2S5A213_9SPHI|nr:YihY/virulence factor BrkB family protein [Solitalea longa]POY36302.1 YihY/virulence factor BrkB family protein [Solitalea longa]